MEQNKEKFAKTVKAIGIVSMEKIKGDASERNYFRAIIKKGSSVIIQENLGERAYQKAQIKSNEFLEKHLIPVPKMLFLDEKAGIIVFEDIGDLSLFSYLKNGGKIRKWRRRIEDLLTAFATLPRKKYRPQWEPFDRDKYLWELQFFEKKYLSEETGIRLSRRKKAALSTEYEDIAVFLDRPDKTLIHRDFHSRNIYIFKGELRILDHQDLRVGNYFYDRVSFMWDAYVDHGNNREMFMPFLDRDIHYVKVLALERCLKVLGTFAYLKNEKGKPSYLRFYEKRMLSYLDHLTAFAGYKAIYDIYQEILEKRWK